MSRFIKIKISPANLLAILGITLLANLPTKAQEDPMIGIIKGIQCLNCVKDSVVLSVTDPLEGQLVEIHISELVYNSLITPLPGKRIFARDSGCFYWLEKIKPIAKNTNDSVQIKPSACIDYKIAGKTNL